MGKDSNARLVRDSARAAEDKTDTRNIQEANVRKRNLGESQGFWYENWVDVGVSEIGTQRRKRGLSSFRGVCGRQRVKTRREVALWMWTSGRALRCRISEVMSGRSGGGRLKTLGTGAPCPRVMLVLRLD